MSTRISRNLAASEPIGGRIQPAKEETQHAERMETLARTAEQAAWLIVESEASRIISDLVERCCNPSLPFEQVRVAQGGVEALRQLLAVFREARKIKTTGAS